MSESVSIPVPERPGMKDYGIHTDAAGMLSWSWVDERMSAARNYWIASTRPDSRPHVAPVWGVWEGTTLYFSSARTARKARNLLANPAVSVHLESGDEVVIIEGRVSVFDIQAESENWQRIGTQYAQKYAPYNPLTEDHSGGVFFRIQPQTVLAWLETDYPATATRWRFK